MGKDLATLSSLHPKLLVRTGGTFLQKKLSAKKPQKMNTADEAVNPTSPTCLE